MLLKIEQLPTIFHFQTNKNDSPLLMGGTKSVSPLLMGVQNRLPPLCSRKRGGTKQRLPPLSEGGKTEGKNSIPHSPPSQGGGNVNQLG